MMHLILGHARDPHAQHMQAQLQRRGYDAGLIETHKFPSEIALSIYPGRSGGALTLADGHSVDFADIGSVYWRNFCGVTSETTKATRGTPTDIAYYDAMACIRSWFQASGATKWINSWDAFQLHQEKPHQLSMVAGIGVTIPLTYVGNSAQAILAFHDEVKDCIFKPVYGGSHTQRVTPSHLAPSHLAKALIQSPITLQQYIAGTNIRTFVVGSDCYSAQMHSDRVDFRADADIQVIPIETPADIATQARAVCDVLGLAWTAIDWRRDEQGRYFFLEANPSPMFLAFERKTGYPICDALIRQMTT